MENQSPPRRRTSQKNKPVIKRLLANKCERERVRKINEAFEVLKTHIPYCDAGRIRTKLDVLKFAIDYIQILSKMVSQNEAAMLLKASQMDGTGLGFANDEGAVPKPSGMNYTEDSTAFPFNEHPSLMGMSSPTLRVDRMFFRDEVNQEQISNQFQQQQEQQQQWEQQSPQQYYQYQHQQLRQQQQKQQQQHQHQEWEHQQWEQQIPLTNSEMDLPDSATTRSDVKDINTDEELSGWILL